MDIGTISRRYARALLEFACERGTEETVYKQVQQVLQQYENLPDFRHIIENPMVEAQKKLALLQDAAGGKEACKEVCRFFSLLLEKKREKLLAFILHSFLFLYHKKKKIRRALLITASPVPQETLEKLKKVILQFYRGKEVIFDSKVNPALIGGGILGVGYWMVDASVAGQLKEMKKQFIEKNRRIV